MIDRYQDAVREISEVVDWGDTLARRRRALGITQEQLAFSIGVNRRVVGELERGKETVQLGIALRALQAVGVRVLVEPWQ